MPILILLLLVLAPASVGAEEGLAGYEVIAEEAPAPASETDMTGRPPDALPDGAPARGDKDIAEAWLVAPTKRYRHGVLGDDIEAGGVEVKTAAGERLRFLLPQSSVFEDLAPRLADLDGDGRDEIVLVRSYLDNGSALAILGLREGELRVLAETPSIGRPFRWLNPVGAGDFDGDGRLEVAYVKTPHIGGTLKVWRWDGRALSPVAETYGVSNHVLGSRALGLSAIADLDGDGAEEMLVPDMSRRTVYVFSINRGRVIEEGSFRHPSPVVTDFSKTRVADGWKIGYGLADERRISLVPRR